MLESSKENFEKLESRLLGINSNVNNANDMRDMIYDLCVRCNPTLIMATGGSKVVAYYLQLLLGDQMICEVIEPRDFFYRYDIDKYSNLIVISASGNTNGIKEALKNFKGLKYLVCEKQHKEEYQVVSWGNDTYDKEHSFISIASSLGPIAVMLNITSFGAFKFGISDSDIKKTNEKIIKLLKKSKDTISKLSYSFKDAKVVQVISGYDTKCSSCTLESNLIEAGLCAPIIHDKGSFCHGRSNILSNETPIIYLSHDYNELDNLIINSISDEYQNILQFNTIDIKDEDILWREFYLLLQMYYLSKKIADYKNKDLTNPNYNRKLVKTLYNYRGSL